MFTDIILLFVNFNMFNDFHLDLFLLFLFNLEFIHNVM